MTKPKKDFKLILKMDKLQTLKEYLFALTMKIQEIMLTE